MSSKGKTRYLAELGLYKFIRENPLFYFWTNSFAGEGVHDKSEAERRLKPLKDMLDREGAKYHFFWEQHPGGHGWHLHWVTNKYLDVKWFRPWMMERGWGQQMKGRRIEASPARFDGKTWRSDESAVRGVVVYLIKYVTKDVVDTDGTKKKVWSCSKGYKLGTVRFAWCKWIKPGAYLYATGLKVWLDRGMDSLGARWKNTGLIIRMGVQASNWLEIDPWWMPNGP